MSAWYIFNSFGFYPVNPASGEYIVGTPLFEEVEILLPPAPSSLNGQPHKITISAPGAPNDQFVKGLAVDGVARAVPVLKHAELYSTSALAFAMDDSPQSWGAGML